MSLVTGLLFGTAPAWFAARTNPAEVLHGAGRSTRDGRALPQKALVVVQAALSVVLLTGAGLLTRSLMKMEHQNFGFETDHRVSLRVNAPFSVLFPGEAGRDISRTAGATASRFPACKARRWPCIRLLRITGTQ